MAGSRQIHRPMRLWLALLGMIALSACSFVPKYQRPDLQLPPDWTPVGIHQEPFQQGWWSDFSDPNLARLVELSQTNNLDIRATAQRLFQAQAQARFTRGSLLPAVELGGSVERTRKSQNGQTGGGGTSGDAEPKTLYRHDMAAAYEIDFWGKNRALFDSATALANATAQDVRTVSITAESETAISYISACAWNERLAILRNVFENATDTLAVLQSAPGNGIANDLEVHRQKASIANIEAQVVAATQQASVEYDKLKVLLGGQTAAPSLECPSFRTLTVPRIPAGIPSSILACRSDVSAAENRLIAANADIGAARAAFLPSIELTAQRGYESVALASLISPSSILYTALADVTAPIFSGGRLKAQLAISEARKAELVEPYRQAALNAFRDTHTTIVAAEQLSLQEAARETASQEAQIAYHEARSLLQQGQIDSLSVLDAQREHLFARDAIIDVRLARLLVAIGFYKAVGGDCRAAKILLKSDMSDRP